MYEELTVEEIKSDILSRMDTDIDVREGSYTNDMISAVSHEIWKMYQSLDALIPIVYVDETSGEYIDKKCAEYGIKRKLGNEAVATLRFIGVDGTTIPEDKVFLTAEGLEFVTDTAVTIIGGTATVTASAAEIGEQYNVVAGTITRQYANLSGLSSVTNDAAIGGTNQETDIALVARLYNYLQKPATSGNIAHYKQWALEVDGVGNTKVTPLWNGPGTVRVLIVGSDNEPVDSVIVDNCMAHIEANRPIGAAVTVISAEQLEINIDAVITMESNTTIEIVRQSFETALKQYLRSIAFEKYVVVYNRIAYILLDIDGVIDYTLLTVNGDIENVTVGENQVPIIGTVEVT
jgi:uncharacterized phage protein gp47/JayE